MKIDEVIAAIPDRLMEGVTKEYEILQASTRGMDPAVMALALFLRLGANMRGMKEVNDLTGGAVGVAFPDELAAFRKAHEFIGEQLK